ncbi:MAG TPA: hypothetical protein DCG34_00105 [Clostridiales bacterium]|jgi:hypothetical protein|nr:hypothetical protein [Clostridiales bacterium]
MVEMDRSKLIAIVDYRIDEQISERLDGFCSEIIKTRPHPSLMEPVNGHPDMMMMRYDDSTLIVCPEEYEFYHEILQDKGIRLIKGTNRLRSKYPADIPYNALRNYDSIIHHNAYTDNAVVELATEDNLNFVDVKQGYTKCSVLQMENHGIITADKQIAEAAGKLGIDNLVVQSGYVGLNGFDYGFIGGASGYSQGCLLLTGTIDHHPDHEAIQAFVSAKGVRLIFLSDKPIYDYGTIIILKKEKK